jgi:hypothetical protein
MAAPTALLIAMVAAGLVVGACQPAPASRAPVAPSPSEAAADMPATDAEQQQMRVRTDFGLPADLAHVRAVAADPTALEYLSILMLPSEVAEMQARASNIDAVRAVIQAEADGSPGDFCGFYIDNANRGAVTSMWKANLAVHAANIRSKVRPTARLAFQDCRFSEQELDRVCELLNADDKTWMADIPATWIGWGCGSSDNFVAMEISSAVPDAAERVLRHYTDAFGLPAGILVVRSDGTGARLKPWGTVLVTVLGLDGRPVGPNSLNLDWSSDFVGLQCGGGDVGYGVSWDDQPTELPCQEGTWKIEVVATAADTTIYGSSIVQVRGNAVTKVTFRLKEAPPPLGQ